jgi:hypothetical protein
MVPAPASPTARTGRDHGLLATLRRALLRVVFPFRPQIPENAVSPQEAVTAFLGTMASTATRTCVQWRKLLEAGLNDCDLSYDARHDFFEAYPIEDYYFAGVVALEAARIRQVYPSAEADALLGEIGDQVDRAGNRGDRVLSDMVFEVIGRIELSSGLGMQKMPYDKVTSAILRHLDIHRNEATQNLMDDKAFRHALGEPLAMGFQNWWTAFSEKFVVYVPEEPEEEIAEEFEVPAPAAEPHPVPRPSRRKQHKAEVLI